jgi:hypothetical protein
MLTPAEIFSASNLTGAAAARASARLPGPVGRSPPAAARARRGGWPAALLRAARGSAVRWSDCAFSHARTRSPPVLISARARARAPLPLALFPAFRSAARAVGSATDDEKEHLLEALERAESVGDYVTRDEATVELREHIYCRQVRARARGRLIGLD